MNQLHSFFHSTSGKVAAGVLLLAAVVLGGWTVRGMLQNSSEGEASRDRVFVCAETGKSFHYHLEVGTEIPVLSPYSKKNTGYPAELCYWTADGQIKNEPTAVLLNADIGQPGPTFCPECNRLVVGRNPRPRAGWRPPLTKEEYERRTHR